MSSMFGTAFQVTNTIVEMLFILDHRLRDHAKQYRSLKRVCDDIFDSLVTKFTECNMVEDMFTPQRLYQLPELHDILRDLLQHPSLNISNDCFVKLFNMATMAVKLQVLRCNRLMDMSLVTEGKLRELRDMTASPALRDELTRIKGGLSVFYGSLSAGELARVRTNLLNNYRKYNHPVGVLISFGFQSENGHFIIPTDGPNMQNLGAATVYCEDGSIMDEYVLPIAGKSVEAVPQYVGDNLFSAKWVLRRQRGAANNNMDTGCSRSEPSGYTGDSGSGTEYDNDLAACCVADDSDTDSVCSTASYAERLQATRAAAAGLGSPSAAGVHGGGRGRSSDPIQDF